MKRILIGGAVAIVALSVVAYAFASGGDDAPDPGNTDDLVQVQPTPPGGAAIDLPTGTPEESPGTGGNAASGTRPVGSDEPFGPAGEPGAKPLEPTAPDQPATDLPRKLPPDAPVSVTPSTPPSVDSAQPPAPSPLPPDRVPEPAPIDGVDIRVAESFPPQYFLHIKAGLPGGCAERYTYAVSRAGDVVTVTVLNSTVKNAICTAIYGMYELNINLGSDFESGKTYTVKVNDRTITFKAQ